MLVIYIRNISNMDAFLEEYKWSTLAQEEVGNLTIKSWENWKWN